MSRPPQVYIRLPRVGLGNMLYVWAKGLVLASRLEVKPVISSWTQLHPGALLRGERSARLYWRQLRSSPLPARLAAWWHCRKLSPFVGDVQALDPVGGNMRSPCLVSGMSDLPPDNSFRDLKAHRPLLRAAFEKMLYPQVRRLVDSIPAPCIGVHVRRGDFRNSSWLTPIEYFCIRLKSVREVSGQELPAMVFSDGSDAELAPLLQMASVVRAPRRSDVIDLCALSKSRLIIVSGVSTFSNWASFFSDGIIIRNPRWMHQDIRPQYVNDQTYEGMPEMDRAQWPDLLLRNIAALGA